MYAYIHPHRKFSTNVDAQHNARIDAVEKEKEVQYITVIVVRPHSLGTFGYIEFVPMINRFVVCFVRLTFVCIPPDNTDSEGGGRAAGQSRVRQQRAH